MSWSDPNKKNVDFYFDARNRRGGKTTGRIFNLKEGLGRKNLVSVFGIYNFKIFQRLWMEYCYVIRFENKYTFGWNRKK